MSVIGSLKFTVFENGKVFPVSQMTEPECAAIDHCVDDLVPRIQSQDIWPEVDTVRLDSMEDDTVEGLLLFFRENPNPKNGSLNESRLAAPIPAEIVAALAGKTFRIFPPQYGLSPWGAKVEIVFEDPRPTAGGTMAAHLIAEAKKAVSTS